MVEKIINKIKQIMVSLLNVLVSSPKKDTKQMSVKITSKTKRKMLTLLNAFTSSAPVEIRIVIDNSILCVVRQIMFQDKNQSENVKKMSDNELLTFFNEVFNRHATRKAFLYPEATAENQPVRWKSPKVIFELGELGEEKETILNSARYKSTRNRRK